MAEARQRPDGLGERDEFAGRHIGPNEAEIATTMLGALGLSSMAELIDRTVPASIRTRRPLALPPPLTETEALARLRELAAANRLAVPLIGMGYHGTHHAAGDPAQRAREPRLVHGLHALPGRDHPGPARGAAQLPDDGHRPHRHGDRQRLAARRGHRRRRGDDHGHAGSSRGKADSRSSSTQHCHPQTIEVVRPAPAARHRASSSAIRSTELDGRRRCSAPCSQYPATDGAVRDYRALIDAVHAAGALAVVATDLLALALLTPPGELGADIARRQRAALRRAAGLRRPARRLLRHQGRVQARRCRAGSSASRVDAAGPPRAPHGAADPRAAHPPREGDRNICTAQVLLADHGRHVRRLSRARGPDARSPSRVHG